MNEKIENFNKDNNMGELKLLKEIANAQYNLGVCYKKGEGVEVDMDKAVYYYNLSVEEGM